MRTFFCRVYVLYLRRLQVRGAFEKLYSFLAGELETAAQQGDTPLQFALMDAWGVEVHEDDHDLLARVRIFNILQVGVPSVGVQSGCSSLPLPSLLRFRRDFGAVGASSGVPR